MKRLLAGTLVLFVAAVGFLVYRILTVRPHSPARSPLAEAVSQGDAPLVKKLLDSGADPNQVLRPAAVIKPDGEISMAIDVPFFGPGNERGGAPLLVYAAMVGNTEIMRLLIDKGANVDAADEYGQTALIMAAWYGDRGAVELLLAHHADGKRRDDTGKTALAWAKSEKHADVVAVLQKAGFSE